MDKVTSGPSDAACAAVTAHLSGSGDWSRAVPGILAAAHDPALGLDRSVCLRGVVEWLRAYERQQAMNMQPHPDCVSRVWQAIQHDLGGGA